MSGRPDDRGWLRAAGLLCATVGFAIAQPGVLIAVPFILMAVVLPPRSLLSLLIGLLATAMVFGGSGAEGIWYVERGWALLVGGWFVALSLRWPEADFSERSLGAVAGAFGITTAFLAVRPGDWRVLDWLVGRKIETAATGALEALRIMAGGEGVSEALTTAAYRTAEIQWHLFPALLGLTSVSALGVAWWLHVRITRGRGDGLGPLAEFRFNDQLVWVLIAGLVPVAMVAMERLVGTPVWPGAWGEPPVRFGANALVFMGALYALRGAAVVVFLYGGLNLLGVMLFVLGLLFVAPIIVSAAMIIGIGDTWLDLRARSRPEAQEP